MLVSSDVMEKRRYYVKSIGEIVQFLAINELSFRGSYDKSFWTVNRSYHCICN